MLIFRNNKMKRHFAILFLSLWAVVAAVGQTMSDEEVLRMVVSEKRSGATETDIATRLMQKGATLEQINRIRDQYASQISKRGLDSTVDNAIDGAQNRMRTNNEPKDDGIGIGIGNGIGNGKAKDNSKGKDNDILQQGGAEVPQSVPEVLSPSGKRVFGRDIFNNKNLSFEPVMNIATPQDYVLGPGDQLIVDIYGASQQSISYTVTPDGDVTIPDYGPIHVSGLTVAAAQSRIRNKVGDIYAGSNIKATLGQTRTISVNVMGEVQVPGTYTISAFATVFHALYRAGGINNLGTLRNIKVFRQGRQITVIDVYEFILNGRIAGNVRLADNDVIQVGPYDCIVDIEGSVKRPMSYELRKGESLSTLLKFCGDFAGNAYRKSLRVIRNTGQMKSVFNVDEFEWADFHMEDGDQVSVESTYDRFENMVEVKGAVFRPGMYQLSEKVNSVRTLIERADGLTEEALTSRAVMRRMKPNRTQEVLSLNLEAILNGSEADVALRNEDVVFIPTLAEHQNLRTLTVVGEVIFPGVYEYADNMTLEDLILQAGGLTDQASTVKVEVSRRLSDPGATEAGMELAKTFCLSLKENFAADGESSFILAPYDIVQVRRNPLVQDPIQVEIDGEITFRGSYTMEKKNQRLSDLVKAAGGVVTGADIRGARLIRKMTEDEQARMQTVIQLARQNADGNDSISLDKLALSTTYSVGIHLDEALANPGSTQDVELIDGDRLVIPRFNHTVRISGDVNAPNTVAYNDGKNYKYYIEQAGGFGDRARKRRAYIVYQNGTIAKASKGKIEPGCEVVVPSKSKHQRMSPAEWLGLGASVASIGTMFASIAHLLK